MTYNKLRPQSGESHYQRDDESSFEARYEEEGRSTSRAQTSELRAIFRDQLIACLEECSLGRRGLFSNVEALQSGSLEEGWPEAARLRELAFALQSILAQEEESDTLCDQFLDLCSIHGDADPGESRLARAFLTEIGGK